MYKSSAVISGTRVWVYKEGVCSWGGMCVEGGGLYLEGVCSWGSMCVEGGGLYMEGVCSWGSKCVWREEEGIEWLSCTLDAVYKSWKWNSPVLWPGSSVPQHCDTAGCKDKDKQMYHENTTLRQVQPCSQGRLHYPLFDPILLIVQNWPGNEVTDLT